MFKNDLEEQMEGWSDTESILEFTNHIALNKVYMYCFCHHGHSGSDLLKVISALVKLNVT